MTCTSHTCARSSASRWGATGIPVVCELPDFADRIVATAGTAKTYPHGVMRLEGQIAALTADAAFNGGDYAAPPTKGLSAFAAVWGGWLYSQEWWRRISGAPCRGPMRRWRSRSRISGGASSGVATPTISFCKCAPGSGTTSAPRRGSTAISSAHSNRSGSAALHAVGNRSLLPDR
jgi:hypothetical protein